MHPVNVSLRKWHQGIFSGKVWQLLPQCQHKEASVSLKYLSACPWITLRLCYLCACLSILFLSFFIHFTDTCLLPAMCQTQCSALGIWWTTKMTLTLWNLGFVGFVASWRIGSLCTIIHPLYKADFFLYSTTISMKKLSLIPLKWTSTGFSFYLKNLTP